MVKPLIGDWQRWAVLPVYFRGPGNALLIGPPGSGKGQAIITNALRQRWLALNDVDGETSAICYQEWVRQGYDITLLNGADMFGLGSRSLNVFDYANPSRPDFPDRCVFIARLIVTRTGAERDRFFPDKQESGIAAVIGYVAETVVGGTLLTVRAYVTLDAGGFRALAEGMALSRHAFIRAQGNEWLRMLQLESKTLDSILSGIERDTFFLESSIARRLFRATDCRLANLKGTDKDGRRLRGAVLSVIMPVAHLEDQAPSLRLIAGCLILELTSGAKPRHRIFWPVDEFPALKKFPALTDFLAVSRKHRVQVQIAAQSVAQIRDTYGEHGFSAIETHCQLQQFFAPRSLEDSEYLSRKLGNQTVLSKDGRTTVSRPLVTVEELQSLPERRQIVWVGHRKNPRPAIMAVRPYWERVTLRAKASANPYFGSLLPPMPPSLPFEYLWGLCLRVVGWIFGPSLTFAALVLLLAAWWLGAFDGHGVDLARHVCRRDLGADFINICRWRMPWP